MTPPYVADVLFLSTIILGIWAALGHLVGVCYGHVLKKRWQEERWIADNELQEYRELIGIFTNSFATIVQLGHGEQRSSDDNRAGSAAEVAALHNRLFIA